MSGRHACGMLGVGRTVRLGEIFSNAQWSLGSHGWVMLRISRTVRWGDKLFKWAVVIRATQVRHVGPTPHSGTCEKFYNGQVVVKTTWANHVGGKSHNKKMWNMSLWHIGCNKNKVKLHCKLQTEIKAQQIGLFKSLTRDNFLCLACNWQLVYFMCMTLFTSHLFEYCNTRDL